MNDRLQPRCAPRLRRQNPFGEAFREDLAPAQDSVAAETAGDHQELNDPPRERQIDHASLIPAMDTPGYRSARWTHANASGGPDCDDRFITFVARTLYNKPTRHQTGAVECLLRGANSPQSKRQRSPKLQQK